MQKLYGFCINSTAGSRGSGEGWGSGISIFRTLPLIRSRGGGKSYCQEKVDGKWKNEAVTSKMKGMMGIELLLRKKVFGLVF